MCQPGESAPGPADFEHVAIASSRLLILTVLEIEIGADQPAFLAVTNRWGDEQSRLHIGQSVQLECDVRPQQVKVVRVGQQRNRPIDCALNRAECGQIAGDRGSLIEAINILRYPLRIGRRVERRGATHRGNILLDLPDLGLVAGQRRHRRLTKVPPDMGSRAKIPYRSSVDWVVSSVRSARQPTAPDRSVARRDTSCH